MNAIADSLPQNFGTTEQKLAALFHADIMKVYQNLGHSTGNLKNREGFAIVLLSSKVIGDGCSLNITYKTINFLKDLSNRVPSIFSSLSHVFDKYPDDNFFFIGQTLNYCRCEDLYTRYFTLLYRLFSVIAKADNTITEKEAAWLNKLMELNHQSHKDEGVFNVGETSNDSITSKVGNSNIESNPFEDLNKLIGLSNVKSEISSLSNLVKVQQVRKTRGMSASNISYHCVFTGNPGTGKTTVARIVAEIYKNLGVLKKGHLIETDRSGLVGEYIGQTAPKTNAIIDSALDGVLFIDEAYSLVQGGQNDYGKEAISTLLKRMEDDRDRLIVILAGYSKEMEDFINSNSGLQSRFNRYIEFPDYTGSELIQIFNYIAKKNDYILSDAASTKVKSVIEGAVRHKDLNFGNARFVRNLFEKIITQQANRITAEPKITNEMLAKIDEIDIINAVK
jgi:AAA+ superfamily predicted ATPase